MRVLRKEMTGDDVGRWQFFLVGQNHQLEVNGNFNDDTYNATRAFQTDNHLDIDGRVGSETLGCAMTWASIRWTIPTLQPTADRIFHRRQASIL